MTAVIPILLLLASNADIGPSLPPRTTPFIADAAYKTQLALSKSQFAEAAAELKKWPGKEVRFTVSGLPAKYASCAATAAALWEEASGNRIKIVPAADGLIKVSTVPSAAMVSDPIFKDDHVVAELPLSLGGAETSVYTATWTIAKAIGMGLGLAPNLRRLQVTGPVLIAPDQIGVPKLSADIVERVRLVTLIEAREVLEKAIQSKTVLVPAAPKISIDKTVMDGGVAIKGTKPRFEVRITNTGNAPLRLEFEVSCHCLLVSPPQIVEPGKDIRLTAELDTSDYTGKVEKLVNVYSNDLTNGHIPIRITVTSMPEFRVLPENMPVVALNDEGPTDFDLTVYSTMNNDTFEVTTTQLSKPKIEANVFPFEGDVVDSIIGTTPLKRKGSIVRLTIPETQPGGLDWVRVIIMTNLKSKMPYADVTVQMAKGIYAQPKAAFYGQAKVGGSDKRTITIEHPSKTFKIKSIDVEGDGIAATQEPDGTSGRKYRVTVTTKFLKSGQQTGKVTVNTDNLKYPTIVLPVTAIVG